MSKELEVKDLIKAKIKEIEAIVEQNSSEHFDVSVILSCTITTTNHVNTGQIEKTGRIFSSIGTMEGLGKSFLNIVENNNDSFKNIKMAALMYKMKMSTVDFDVINNDEASKLIAETN